jgi:sn-glycerol 3-phosphate transport system permease protein
MVENRPWLSFLTHLVLITGVVIVVFPVYLAFIASTHGSGDFTGGAPAARTAHA